MRSSFAAAVAIAAFVQSAHAATTQLRWEVSVNGGPFTTSATHQHGIYNVTFRLRVNLTGNTGAGSIAGSGGLASLSILPTLSSSFGEFPGWDTPVAMQGEQFAEGTASNPFPGVINHPSLGTISNVYTGVPSTFRGPGNTNGSGRHSPWGATGTNADGVATPHWTASVLSWRSAQLSGAGVLLHQTSASNSVVNAITGVSDNGTPGDSSDDTLIVESVGQYASLSRTSAFTVFSYSVVLRQFNGYGDRVFTASSEVLSPALWYTNAAGATAAVPLSDVIVTPATLIFKDLPAPGPVALLGVAGLFAARRRRA